MPTLATTPARQSPLQTPSLQPPKVQQLFLHCVFCTNHRESGMAQCMTRGSHTGREDKTTYSQIDWIPHQKKGKDNIQERRSPTSPAYPVGLLHPHYIERTLSLSTHHFISLPSHPSSRTRLEKREYVVGVHPLHPVKKQSETPGHKTKTQPSRFDQKPRD